MMKKDKKQITFIVVLSIFLLLWVTSLIFLGFATLSESITDSIQSWYSEKFSDPEGTTKTLNLLKVSTYATIITTVSVVITLLSKEIKKKYL